MNIARGMSRIHPTTNDKSPVRLWSCPLCMDQNKPTLGFPLDEELCGCGGRRCLNCGMVTRPDDWNFCPGCGTCRVRPSRKIQLKAWWNRNRTAKRVGEKE